MTKQRGKVERATADSVASAGLAPLQAAKAHNLAMMERAARYIEPNNINQRNQSIYRE